MTITDEATRRGPYIVQDAPRGDDPYADTHGAPVTVRVCEPTRREDGDTTPVLAAGDLVAAHAHGLVLRVDGLDDCDPEWFLAGGPAVDGVLNLGDVRTGAPARAYQGARTTVVARRRHERG